MGGRVHVVCLRLGLLFLAAILGTVQAAEPGPPAADVSLPAPQWVGGSDDRGKAKLTWIRSPSFSSVRLYRRDEGPSTPFLLIAETRDNTWLDGSVQPGRIYRYRLAGVGADGREGRASAELAVRIGVATLRAPAPPEWEGFVPLEDGVGLKWAAREGEDIIAWNIYRRTPPDTELRLIGSSRTASYRDTGLAPDRLYVYALTALDSTFRETTFSQELGVMFTRPEPAGEKKAPDVWRVRRTRQVATVAGGHRFVFQRPADVAVGPVTGSIYVADSGHNLVFVFSPQGIFQRTVGGELGGATMFTNVLGVATDRDENLFVVDAGTGSVQTFTREGRPGPRVDLPPPPLGGTGLIDAAVAPDGRLFVVDNFNNRVTVIDGDGARTFGQAGGRPGELSAPTFCEVDAAGSLVVADALNGRVQVFSGAGEFLRAFGRAERGPGGFGRPKGVAVGGAGEVFVADSWLNTVQVFDADGRFVAVLGDEEGRPLDLGSPNGVALGAGRRVYIAERLAARLQIREMIDE